MQVCVDLSMQKQRYQWPDYAAWNFLAKISDAPPELVWRFLCVPSQLLWPFSLKFWEEVLLITFKFKEGVWIQQRSLQFVSSNMLVLLYFMAVQYAENKTWSTILTNTKDERKHKRWEKERWVHNVLHISLCVR